MNRLDLLPLMRMQKQRIAKEIVSSWRLQLPWLECWMLGIVLLLGKARELQPT